MRSPFLFTLAVITLGTALLTILTLRPSGWALVPSLIFIALGITQLGQGLAARRRERSQRSVHGTEGTSRMAVADDPAPRLSSPVGEAPPTQL